MTLERGLDHVGPKTTAAMVVPGIYEATLNHLQHLLNQPSVDFRRPHTLLNIIIFFFLILPHRFMKANDLQISLIWIFLIRIFSLLHKSCYGVFNDVFSRTRFIKKKKITNITFIIIFRYTRVYRRYYLIITYEMRVSNLPPNANPSSPSYRTAVFLPSLTHSHNHHGQCLSPLSFFCVHSRKFTYHNISISLILIVPAVVYTPKTKSDIYGIVNTYCILFITGSFTILILLRKIGHIYIIVHRYRIYLFYSNCKLLWRQ